MDFFVGAVAIGAEIFVRRAAIDRKGSVTLVEADQILFVDVAL